MLQANKPMEEIMEFTELPLKEILKLQQKTLEKV